MLKLNQTKTNKFNDLGVKIERGNCYAACVAMMIGKNIEDVPEFEHLPDDGSWFTTSWDFLTSIGYSFDVHHFRHGEPIPDGYVIACGKSPRGDWGHSVVYFNGELYHDPYPSGNGIDKVDYCLIIQKNET